MIGYDFHPEARPDIDEGYWFNGVMKKLSQSKVPATQLARRFSRCRARRSFSLTLK
jgi:hypothetical protein